ncbi:carboxymuconolactone decarboxylase family protein [Aliiruegeria lutimaris]|uniref:Alkylhydroperoxidase AhpD family core domain-containing protein n=1 Tax=Aliiruegeria lutimaris TaxID=571298 RepID=A0A1G8PJ06_9RHOB|nr:carboxymuconolactone decarboxylase family protein [Aliiruegeria lutimaris]SDI92205.1 alkylhydroperoxidase AhpD family core domain-containing protein [Aliiruegeria lutimaris]
MDWNNFVDDMNDQLRELSKANPEVTKGFSTLTKAAKESGTLDVKSKEFVALGISIAMRCEPCIGFHVKALAKAGGTREELVDVLGMAIQMGGGPSLMYAAKTLAAWDQLVSK